MTEDQLVAELKDQHGEGWIEQMILLAIDGYHTPASLLTIRQRMAASIAYDWLQRVVRDGVRCENGNSHKES